MSTSTRTQQSCANLRLTSRCRKLPQFSHAITLVVYGAVKSCANEPTDVNSLCLTIASSLLWRACSTVSDVQTNASGSKRFWKRFCVLHSNYSEQWKRY